MMGDAKEKIAVENQCDVEIGDKEVFGVVDPHGIAHVGNRTALSQIVGDWVESISEPLSRMSFARFCNNVTLAEGAAIEAIQEKAKDFGSEAQAVKWFVYVVVVVDLLRALRLSGDQSEDPFIMGAVRVEVDKERVIVVLPDAVLGRERKLRKDFRLELTKALEFAHHTTGRAFNLRPQSDDAKDAGGQEDDKVQLLRIMRNIASHTRQEERLAEVMKIILESPELGLDILNKYDDRGMLAQSVLDLLKSFSPADLMAGKVENSIASVLPSIIRSAYPTRKGPLLLALATSLHESASLRDIIFSMTAKSRARDVEELKPQILRALGEH